MWSFCTEPTHQLIHTKRKRKEGLNLDGSRVSREVGVSIYKWLPFLKRKKEEEEDVKSRLATHALSCIGKAGCEKTNHGATALQPRRGFVFVMAIDTPESEVESFAALISQTWDVADDRRFGLHARWGDGLGI